jgi:hypothetical protein
MKTIATICSLLLIGCGSNMGAGDDGEATAELKKHISCNDNNACTTDALVGTQCQHTALADGTACGLSMTCKAGTCTSVTTTSPPPCTDPRVYNGVTFPAPNKATMHFSGCLPHVLGLNIQAIAGGTGGAGFLGGVDRLEYPFYGLIPGATYQVDLSNVDGTSSQYTFQTPPAPATDTEPPTILSLYINSGCKGLDVQVDDNVAVSGIQFLANGLVFWTDTHAWVGLGSETSSSKYPETLYGTSGTASVIVTDMFGNTAQKTINAAF